MGRNPLGTILVLGLISVSQLWEGVQCQGYSHVTPGAVFVQEGLCVVIRCNFTYPKSDPSFTGKLYGYWYEFGRSGLNYPAFATNDEGKELVPGARGRFRLSENLEEGDCSLFITESQPSDQTLYFFRMEKGARYDFFPPTSVRVEETPIPEIQIPGKLQAGQPLNMTCIVASCPWKAPNISWEFTRNISGILSSSSNGTKMFNIVPSFIPLAADNDQFLTCKVTYGSGSTPVISVKAIRLNVSYPPQRLRISGERRTKNGKSQPLTGSHTEAQEGDDLWLRCEAEGNPLPQVTWVERVQSGTQHSLSGNQLTLSNVKLQDMGGYTCQAQNMEGTSETTFQVYMRYSPKMCSRSNTSCWREDDGYRCNCSICSYPGAEIQWVVDGKSVEGNASNKEMEVTYWYKTDKATSTLLLKGTWDGQRLVLCSGNSSTGETSVNFFLYSFNSPKMCSPSNTSCWREDDGIRCNCSICSYPGAEIQWVVDGKSVEGNASNKEMEVTYWYKTDKATSTLLLKGTWDGQRSVLCSGNSSTGETSVNFFLYSFKAQNVIVTESTIIPILLGLSLIKVVFCFPIFSFVVWFSNRRKPPVMREEPSK